MVTAMVQRNLMKGGFGMCWLFSLPRKFDTWTSRTRAEEGAGSQPCVILAEREGFEPPIPVKVWPLSRRLVSTTHAPLRARLPLAGIARLS